MKMILSCLVVLCVLLTSCVAMQPAPANNGTSTAEPMEDATLTEEIASTEAVTETEGMTPTEELAATGEITSPEEMTTAAVSVPFEAVQVILDLAPGAWTPPHTHGGLVLVTILEGEVTERDEVTGEESVYGPGEFWTEEAGHLHAAGNAGQENARVAALFLLPEGASMTTVAEVTPTGDPPPGPTAVSRTSMKVTTATE